MPEDYDALKERVEKYFDVLMHYFEEGRTNLSSCRRCFLGDDNPIHMLKDDKDGQ